MSGLVTLSHSTINLIKIPKTDPNSEPLPYLFNKLKRTPLSDPNPEP